MVIQTCVPIVVYIDMFDSGCACVVSVFVSVCLSVPLLMAFPVLF